MKHLDVGFNMIKTTITIINKLGLHARASAKFVSTANKFQSQLNVMKGTKTINGKSIMSVMTLAASQGTEIILSADGPDEESMTDALVTLINAKFHEAE
jgi:phosphocarrier protein